MTVLFSAFSCMARAQDLDYRLVERYNSQQKAYNTFKGYAIGSAVLAAAFGGLEYRAYHNGGSGSVYGAEDGTADAILISFAAGCSMGAVCFLGFQTIISRSMKNTRLQSDFYKDPSLFLPSGTIWQEADVESLWHYYKSSQNYEKYSKRLKTSSICLGSFATVTLGGAFFTGKNSFADKVFYASDLATLICMAWVAESAAMKYFSKANMSAIQKNLPYSVSLGLAPGGIGLLVCF